MVTERCPEGMTGAKARKEKYSRKLRSLSRPRGRTTAVIHYRGGIVIETLASVGHREGERRRSVAERRGVLGVGERIGEAVALESQKMGMEEESETRALVSCSPTTRFFLPGPSRKLNRRSLQRL